MNSPKVTTQKNISALIAVALALVTLFQAGTVRSNETDVEFISAAEAEIIADIDQMLIDLEEEESEVIVIGELQTEVKVFDQNNNLIGTGDTANDETLRTLVNRADLLSELGGTKYYRISE